MKNIVFILFTINFLLFIIYPFFQLHLPFGDPIDTQKVILGSGIIVVFSYFIFWQNSANNKYKFKSIIALPIKIHDFTGRWNNEYDSEKL